MTLETSKTVSHMYCLCVKVDGRGSRKSQKMQNIGKRKGLARGGTSEGFWRHKLPNRHLKCQQERSVHVLFVKTSVEGHPQLGFLLLMSSNV